MQEQYHSSLLLFQTDFPIRADAAKTDKEIQQKWIDIPLRFSQPRSLSRTYAYFSECREKK